MTLQRRPGLRHVGTWTIVVVACAIGALRIEAVLAGQQGAAAAALYQQAMHEEDALGNLESAIKLYQRVVAAQPDRALAANAQLRIGACYEKLGKTEARKAYEAVLRRYADQTEVVAEARLRLEALGALAGATPRAGLTVRRVWAGNMAAIGATGASPTPDGRSLIFTDWSTGGDLVVRDLTTGENRRLTHKGAASGEYGISPIVSPDGRQVAYAWSDKSASFDLRITPLTGTSADGRPRIVFQNKEEVYIPAPSAWSPDGRRILTVLFRRRDSPQMALISVADGSVQILKPLELGAPIKMGFSPDGRYLVYDLPVRKDAPDRDVFVLALETGREVPLVQHPAIDTAPVWSPDGTRIVFLSDRRGTPGVWVVPVADGQPQGSPELLKLDVGDISPLGFTRDGSFYYSVQSGTQDVFALEIDPATGKRAGPPARITTRFVGSNQAPVWSPDGQQVAYYSRRGGSPQGPGSMALTIRSLGTGEERYLTPRLNQHDPRPVVRWFPDGRSLLVPAREDPSRWSFYRVDVQSGEATLIRRNLEFWGPAIGTPQPAISPDGKAIYYLQQASTNTSSIRVLDLGAGQEKELYRSPAGSPIARSLALSRDGRQLAFFEGADLWAMASSGGEARAVLRAKPPAEDLPPWAGLAWTPDNRHILVVRTGDRRGNPEVGRELWRVPAAGGEPEKLLGLETLWPDIAQAPGLSRPDVHPDGRRIAFTVGGYLQEGAEFWVMKNLLPAPQTAR